MVQLSSYAVVAAAAVIHIISAHPTSSELPFDWRETRHLISFGDSYTYVQGTHGHVNSSFVCSSTECLVILAC